MKPSTPAQTTLGPLEIDRIQSSRSQGGEVRLQLSGRWLEPAESDEEELLVVQVEGRRHRFPAIHTDADSNGDAGEWQASFTVPEWAEPRQDGQAAVWVGNAVVPVPALHGSKGSDSAGAKPKTGKRAKAKTEAPPPAAPHAPRPPAAPHAPRPPAPHASEAPRSGPLADLLLRETVAALHAELEQRTADAARIRGALADAQSELEARAARQSQLEATLGELRVELKRLIEAVEDQRQELYELKAESERQRAASERRLAELTTERDERAAEVAVFREQVAAAEMAAESYAVDANALRGDLAAAQVSREAAFGEAAGLREELERLGSELAATRERVSTESSDLGEATRLLADARALADEIQARRTPA